jgi:hypothetical protein
LFIAGAEQANVSNKPLGKEILTTILTTLYLRIADKFSHSKELCKQTKIYQHIHPTYYYYGVYIKKKIIISPDVNKLR